MIGQITPFKPSDVPAKSLPTLWIGRVEMNGGSVKEILFLPIQGEGGGGGITALV